MLLALLLLLLVQSPLFKAMKQGIPKVLDAFCERLQQRIYIEGTEIVKEGYPVTRLFFILKGSVSRFSTRTMDLGQDMLGRGDFLGEELLIHYLDKITRERSTRSSERSQLAVGGGASIGRSLTRSASQLGERGHLLRGMVPCIRWDWTLWDCSLWASRVLNVALSCICVCASCWGMQASGCHEARAMGLKTRFRALGTPLSAWAPWRGTPWTWRTWWLSASSTPVSSWTPGS